MITTMTNDMSRLRREIDALRDSRSALMANLAEASEALRQDVAHLLGGFEKARAEMSQQTKAELHDSILHVKDAVTGLRQSVTGFRKSFQVDIAGSRRAWRGAGSAPGNEPLTREPAAKAQRKKR